MKRVICERVIKAFQSIQIEPDPVTVTHAAAAVTGAFGRVPQTVMHSEVRSVLRRVLAGDQGAKISNVHGWAAG
jgi:hypothetical protein